MYVRARKSELKKLKVSDNGPVKIPLFYELSFEFSFMFLATIINNIKSFKNNVEHFFKYLKLLSCEETHRVAQSETEGG